MTPRRLEVLQWIRDFIDDNGYSPTVRELTLIAGLASPSTMHFHLQSLQREGLVDWHGGAPRTLRLTTDGLSVLNARRLAA